ncbi:MAG: type IV secretory system conjugative DNA transfer family protein [Candidatus Gracilibacteria bacterium]
MVELLLVLIIVVGAYLWYKRDNRRKKVLEKALSLSFMRVILPIKESDLDEKKDSQSNLPFKDVVSVMEQLLASLHEIGSENYVSFEYAVLKTQVYFYVVVPGELQQLIEKQITSFYPDAIVEIEEDYNIFQENGVQEACSLTLKKEYTYPLKTYAQLESDPLNNITNSLSKIGPDEGAMIQILLKPVADKWQDESKKLAENILNDKKKDKLTIKSIWDEFWKIMNPQPKKDENKRLSPLTEETAKSVEQKSFKVGFEAHIRVLTSAPTAFQAKNQLQSIVSSFVQFSHPRMNSITKIKKAKSRRILTHAIYRLFEKDYWKEPKVILSTDEIASLFHFPHIKFNRSPAIKWQKSKMSAPPDNLPEDGILLGHVNYRGSRKEVRIKQEDRFRHFYIIGQTGTGKSTILQTMMKQSVRKGEGMMMMDPHGELADDFIGFIPRERADDVIIFDPSDTERPLGLNMLEAEGDDEKELVALDAMNMMIKLFGNEVFGPRIQDYFRNGVLTLMAAPEGGTIIDVLGLFVNQDFQKKMRSYVVNPIVKSWWDNTFDGMGDREKQEMIPYFAAKFGQFTTNSTIRNILGQAKSSFDMFQAMQDGKIILCRLSKGLIGDLNAQLLGMILISKLQVSAMRRQKIEKKDRREFFVYVDEFQNFVTDSIESILSEARKYRVSLCLAHQYMDQLEKKDISGSTSLKGAIFGNVGNILAYKTGEVDAEFMAKIFAPVFSEQDISNQDEFKAIMKLSINLTPSRPFNFDVQRHFTMQGYDFDKEAADAYRQLSRLKYGRQREFVDQEIRFRMGAL